MLRDLAASIFAVACLTSAPVFAHVIVGSDGTIVDYSDWRDPVTNRLCCNGKDCEPYPAASVREGRSNGVFGYFLDTGEFIPIQRVIPSPDGQFHRCTYHYNVPSSNAKIGDTRCFAAPMGQS